MQEQPPEENSPDTIARLRGFLTYPLRRLLSYSLENPALLQSGTRLVSHFPKLFNWLLKFAQSHGIVMAAEEPEQIVAEVQSVAELSPQGRLLFDELQRAFSNSPEQNL